MLQVRDYALVSDQVNYAELETIIKELYRVLANRTPGAVVEFGCFNGTTSLFIQRVLKQQADERPFHVYDSFAGLPEKTDADASPAGVQFKAGELYASKASFITNFKKAGLPLPYIHKGWFYELPDSDVPQEIAFAFLDGDFYDSIRTSLRLIENKLSSGATIIVDDYHSESLPGAARAVDEWLRSHPRYTLRPAHSLALITDKSTTSS